MTRVAWAAAHVLVLALAVGARAQDAGIPDPASLLAQAEEAEQRGEVASALRAYRALIAAAPTSRLAGRAERRLDWLEARADDPEALSALLAYRARPARSEADVNAFEARALSMAPGLVRREALTAVAGELDALAARGGHASLVGRAEEAYRRALAEPGLSETERAQLSAGYAALLGREGRTREALLVLDEAGQRRGVLRRRLELEASDRWIRPLAIAVVAALVVLALALVVRAVRAGAGPELARGRAWGLPLAAIAWGALGPFLLGAWYSPEAEHLAQPLAVGLGLVLFLAALAGRALGAHPATPAVTRATVAVAIVAPLAVGYLAIYGVPDGPLAH